MTRTQQGNRPATRTAPRQPRKPGWRQFLRLENLAAIAVLFWMTGPVSPLIPDLEDSLGVMLSMPVNSLSAPPDDDSQFLRLSWYPVYLIVIMLAYPHRRRIWSVVQQNWLLALLLSWTLLSMLWSVSPADTLRRSVALMLSTVFGIYLGARVDTLWVLKLLAVAFGLDMVGSVVCSVAFPAIGVSADAEYAGAWRGLFASKNQLGAMMLIACLGFFVLHMAERRRVYLLGLGGAFAILLLSTSKTPLMIMLALITPLALSLRFYRTTRKFALLVALCLSAACLLLILGAVAIEPILALFGRDTTLTGRTEIWDLSWLAITRSLWLGYGYGAFWTEASEPANAIWSVLNWRVPSSHSGLLELWLGLGLVGVVIFAMLLIRTFSVIASQAILSAREECLWRIGYCLIFVIHSITEPSSMEQTSVSWVLFISIAAAEHRIAERARAVRAAVGRPPPWSSRLLPAAGEVRSAAATTIPARSHR